ncbi:MAG: hypothetical protein ACT4OW_05150 [Nitrososphaerota archaeon]
MKSPPHNKLESIKHCQADGIMICTRCGSTNIKIDGDAFSCNDCNAILCFEHK